MSDQPTTNEIMQYSLETRAKIDTHEAVCTERYLQIAASQKSAAESIKEIRGWLIGTSAGVFAIILGMLGFFAVNQLNDLRRIQSIPMAPQVVAAPARGT